MPSTGTASYTINRDQLIAASMRTLRVLREGDVPNATQVANAVACLEMLVKNMQSKGLQLWAYQLLAIPLAANQQSYTIGPSGADVTSVRPLRLFDGAYIRQTVNGMSFDTPLRVISRLEYLQFGAKASSSFPNSVYYHPGIDTAGGVTSPSTGYGTLFVYTTAAQTGSTIYGNFQRPLYDMTNATDEFDMPQEWFRALRFGLAADLSYEMPVDINIARDVRARAKEVLDEMQDWSVEWAPLQMTPDWSMGNFRSM